MPSLRELQCAFAGGVFDASEAAIVPYIVERGIPAARRLQIYRNNTREGFRSQLAATYPVLERLVGDDYFRQMAWAYQRRHASQSGDLFHVGERLAEFLEAELADGEYRYLAEVARLERACHEVRVAAEARPFDARRLAAMPAERYADLRFSLAPAVRLLSSPYPLLRIWQANQPEVAEPEVIDLAAGGDRLLVRRDGDGIELRRLATGSFALLAAFDASFPLATAIEAALAVDAELVVDTELVRWTALGVIVGFTCEDWES